MILPLEFARCNVRRQATCYCLSYTHCLKKEPHKEPSILSKSPIPAAIVYPAPCVISSKEPYIPFKEPYNEPYFCGNSLMPVLPSTVYHHKFCVFDLVAQKSDMYVICAVHHRRRAALLRNTEVCLGDHCVRKSLFIDAKRVWRHSVLS